MASRPFSLAGVHDFLLEFYPSGCKAEGTNDAEGQEGFCGFFIRCPAVVKLTITLIVGSVKKGPIQVRFQDNLAKGLPAFCRLEDECEGEDIVVGVVIDNPALKDAEAKTMD